MVKNDIFLKSASLSGIKTIYYALVFVQIVMVANLIGGGKNMDAFVAAYTIPLLFIPVFSWTLKKSLIPVLVETRIQDDKTYWDIVNSVITISFVILFTVVFNVFG